MKVCLLNDSFPPVIDGVANAVLNYARHLHELGDEVIVATPRYPDVDYSIYPFKVLAYQSFNTSSLVNGYRAGNIYTPELFELVTFKPDIIHAHAPFSSLLIGKHLRFFTKAPLVFTYHTKFDIDISRAIKFETLKKDVIKYMANFISTSDEIWAVSKGAGENLKSLGCKKDYVVMNNGVDIEKGKASNELILEATSKYDLPENVPVYLFVGRIFEYKGLSIILDALNKINEAKQDFRMVFVGDGPDLEKIKEKINNYNLQDKVFCTGKILDREYLKAWYTRADLFLFPSTYDTNGIVVGEAAACATPSVLIEGSCAAETATDLRNAFLIKENSDSLLSLLSKLGNDLDYMHKCGLNAQDEIYISWDDAVDKARERYEYILNNHV